MDQDPQDAGQEEGRAGGGSSILVVDDEEVIHVSLKRILGRQGHSVDAVLGAPEALERLAAQRYDLVITDLMMPEVNGIEFLQRMREAEIKVPVLMITGYPTIRTALQSLRLGAVDYLAKPFTRDELLGPVNRTLRRGGEPDAGETAEAESAPEPSPGDRFHLREHSWAVYHEDGTMRVGIEPSFLRAIDPIATLEAPGENDLVEQGFVGFRIGTEAGERHNVFVPLSGQVLEVNQQAVDSPTSITGDTWLVRLKPHRLEAELPLLLR